MAEHNDLGRNAEYIARNYLVDKGYAIVDTNWRSGHKEIDIVARQGDVLVVVEVKARKYDSILAPEDAVDMKKIRNLVHAAHSYVVSHCLDVDVRFDIVTITTSHDGKTIIRHITDAFFPPVNV